MKTHYIPTRSYGQETTIVFNPVQSKSKPKKRPQLSSSLIMAISFIGILILSFNAFAKPINYQCKDIEVVGLTGMMDGDVEGTYYQKQVFDIEIDSLANTIDTYSDIKGWSSFGDFNFNKASCETVSSETLGDIYSVCSDHFGQIIINYKNMSFTRTYHSGNIPFTDDIFIGLGECSEVIEIDSAQVVG